MRRFHSDSSPTLARLTVDSRQEMRGKEHHGISLPPLWGVRGRTPCSPKGGRSKIHPPGYTPEFHHGAVITRLNEVGLHTVVASRSIRVGASKHKHNSKSLVLQMMEQPQEPIVADDEPTLLPIDDTPTFDGTKPGEGIHAAATSLVAPRSWKELKSEQVLLLKRGRRISATAIALQDNPTLIHRDPSGPQTTTPPAVALKMLGTVPWFHRVSNTDMRTLMARSRVVYFPPATKILRESSHGTAFYVLLEGRALVSSPRRNIDVVIGSNQSFGETALLPDCHFRREATVTSLEDTWCLRLTLADLKVLEEPPDLIELTHIYYAKMLGAVRWFDWLAASKLLVIATCMEAESYPAGRPVFQQGDIAEKMYIIVKGAVGIFLELPTSTTDVAWTHKNKLLAQFTPESKSPWFGEAALFAESHTPAVGHQAQVTRRGAGAFTLEATQLFSVHVSHAKKFMHALPEFVQMNAAYQKAYKRTNELNHGRKDDKE